MKIAYFKTLGSAKVCIRTAGQQLQFDLVGVQICITYEEAPTEAINFEQQEAEEKNRMNE